MLTVTDQALNKIAELLVDADNPNLKLRTFVQGGGCSGFQYGFAFDEEVQEDDHVLTLKNVTVLVDSISMQYLQGASIHYKDDLNGCSFVIESNPNAQTTCGCGSSFSV